ncbi:MAG: FkbM family methyltransferase [Candidatus Riflebacteria bacterium]|nr:FkbM family methyltransferase [Candidatus Riflebacteria bacterium]
MKKFLNNKSLFDRATEIGFKPAHVAEVGVYKPQTSNIYNFIKAGIKTTLVEPDPKSILQIKEHFSGQNNITLHEVAIFDRTGEIELVQREASTFVSELKASPAILNDNYQVNETDKFVVQAVPFDKIDDGTIDLLSVDVEGAEWFVLKTMASRPAVISLETHGAAYTNPYINEINNWMSENAYKTWYKTGADTVFVRPSVIKASSGDRLTLKIANIYLEFHRLRKTLKKRLTGR